MTLYFPNFSMMLILRFQLSLIFLLLNYMIYSVLSCHYNYTLYYKNHSPFDKH
nr:MAG TPA: hypothetical protein [Bacteriophage sp.]